MEQYDPFQAGEVIRRDILLEDELFQGRPDRDVVFKVRAAQHDSELLKALWKEVRNGVAIFTTPKEYSC